MTPDEHEAQRRMVWIEAMKASTCSHNHYGLAAWEFANLALKSFDARFPAPKSEDEV